MKNHVLVWALGLGSTEELVCTPTALCLSVCHIWSSSCPALARGVGVFLAKDQITVRAQTLSSHQTFPNWSNFS